MRRACRAVSILFGVLYAIALALFAVGTFGLLGQEPDPLAGVFLILLGTPWVQLVGHVPDAAGPWVGALTPLINWAIIGLACALARAAAHRQ
jgi:hypothetical protein